MYKVKVSVFKKNKAYYEWIIRHKFSVIVICSLIMFCGCFKSQVQKVKWVFQDPQEFQGSQGWKGSQDMQVHQALRGARVFLGYLEVQLKALKETEDPKANLAFQVILYL